MKEKFNTLKLFFLFFNFILNSFPTKKTEKRIINIFFYSLRVKFKILAFKITKNLNGGICCNFKDRPIFSELRENCANNQELVS
jgi:hypothetical protein